MEKAWTLVLKDLGFFVLVTKSKLKKERKTLTWKINSSKVFFKTVH